MCYFPSLVYCFSIHFAYISISRIIQYEEVILLTLLSLRKHFCTNCAWCFVFLCLVVIRKHHIKNSVPICEKVRFHVVQSKTIKKKNRKKTSFYGL